MSCLGKPTVVVPLQLLTALSDIQLFSADQLRMMFDKELKGYGVKIPSRMSRFLEYLS